VIAHHPLRQDLDRVVHYVSRPRLDHLALALPLVVFWFVRRQPDARLEMLLGGTVALGLVLLIRRYPGPAFVSLVAWLPLQTILLSVLYRFGVPRPVLRPFAAWKELVVVGLLMAGARALSTGRSRLDALDKAALAYVGVVTLYLLFPRFFVQPTGFYFFGPPLDLGVRSLAYRVDVLFVLAFLGCRHAGIGRVDLHRACRAILVVGGVAAAVAAFEFFFSGAWNTVAVRWLGVTKYQREVLALSINSEDVRSYVVIAGRTLVRPGSIFLNPLALGFFLVLPLALAVERVLRRPAPFATHLLVGLIAAALFLSYVRSAILAALVVAVVSMGRAAGHVSTNRVRFALVLGVVVVLGLPAAAGTGLAARTAEVFDAEAGSTSDHLAGLGTGIDHLFTQPLGRGLGTQPGVGDRFATAGRVTSENSYLQVGNEVGVVALALFVTVTVLLLRRLNAYRDVPSAGWPLVGLRAAGIGLAVGALFLHIWLDFALALSFWGAAGAALGAAERERSSLPSGH
jgi:hypothetical protein